MQSLTPNSFETTRAIPEANRLLFKLFHRLNRLSQSGSNRGLFLCHKFIEHTLGHFAKNPIIVPTAYGFRMIVDPDAKHIIERSIYYEGSYEAGTIHILDQCLRKGDNFIDVGANIGLMSLFASRKIGHEGLVYAFEPQEESYDILNNNITLNSAGNIRTFPIGIGSSRSTATLFRSTQIGRGADSFLQESQDAKMWKKEVEVHPLDEIVQQNKIPTVRMLKIDVEGWELEVLKGAKKLLSEKSAPIICVECSVRRASKGSPDDIFEFVRNINDYRVFKLEKKKAHASGLVELKTSESLPRHDNLFCFTEKTLVDLPKKLFATSL